MAETPPILTGLSGTADRYDGFILDLWGVLHDGVRAYPGAADALARLKAGAKRIVLLSNSPGRRRLVADKMAGMGIGPDLYDHLVTSGEVTFEALRDRDDPFHAALGRRCFLIGTRHDRHLLEGLDGVDPVDEPAGADFVLVTGAHRHDSRVEDYEDCLAACAARGLPMVCANPDLIVMVGSRDMAICAGALARRYEEMGGRVAYHGKPHPPVYRRCLDLMGNPDARRVLAVGDSLRTDVQGAARAGLDAAFTACGIHREELGTLGGGAPEPARVAALLADAPYRPTWILPDFRW
ncbi:MAG TPA: TIGR01459 family HAD-type hydrolase [Azospirillaceae bacterium]|nr:TIGR01459 family HAD-type hydrolase [Azospirillaceae bacterium]